MKRKIENPKVFISYAWADKDYQDLVLSFASQLVHDGVDVIFDKWDLSEGNDTYAFMEKCATDPSVTNVLMLLDPVYAIKADEHSGGVGTETQIISAKVYNEVTQDKFIPVVMKRDEEGRVCKPTYLQGRLHFDLSVPEKYDETYQRLVKTLYGEEIYSKPDLGTKPSWVDKPITVAPRSIMTYDSLKNSRPDKIKNEKLLSFLNELSTELIEFVNKAEGSVSNPKEYIAKYDETEHIKTRFLQLIKSSGYVENSHQFIASFFEDTANSIARSSSFSEIARIRLHELFLYTIAYFLKNKDYHSTGYLLGKTYFNNNQRLNNYGADNYRMFYTGAEHQTLDNAIKSRDNKRYHTGTGQHWIETLDTDFCSKEQFILADLICYNYSVYGIEFSDTWPWFPITYVYDNEYNSALGIFTKKMVSKEYAQQLLPLFGYESIDDLKSKMKLIEEEPRQQRRDIRYPEAFGSAPVLSDFIKAGDVGSRR